MLKAETTFIGKSSSNFIISRIHHGLVGKKIGSKELSLKTKTFCFCFYFRYLLPPADTRVLPPASSPEEEEIPAVRLENLQRRRRGTRLCAAGRIQKETWSRMVLKQSNWRGFKLLLMMTKLSSNQNFSLNILTLFQASITPSPCSCDTPWLQNRWHLKNVRTLPRGSSKEN